MNLKTSFTSSQRHLRSSSFPSSNDDNNSNTTETIGNEYEGDLKWAGIIKGSDNCFYCLPHCAKQLLKVDPSNDVTTLVGEEYYGGSKWCNGFAHGDFIYGIPLFKNQFLKYNTKTETSELVGDDFGNNYGKWCSGAVADDGCFYCFPFSHNRILKFNPNDDTTICVGEEIKGHSAFSGTIKAKNGCLYGIPLKTSRVAKFNVATQTVTFIGEKYRGGRKWIGGVEGMDDNIYGVPYRHDKWLKIDIATETISLVGDHLFQYKYNKYNCGVVGEDCNVYAIPAGVRKVTKFNTTTQEILEVGNRYDGEAKWSGGVLHSNGYIYCVPFNHNKVLKIKTNHIREEGNNLLESNASLTEFNNYINSYQFEYIYVTHKALYDRIVCYRNNLIVENAKLALESLSSSRESKDELDAELS